MANGMDQLGALFNWINRGRPQAAAPSRLSQFAMMPQGGLMGGGWDATVAPPIPQQMPPEQLQQMQAMEAYRLLGGGAPPEPASPPLPQQMPPDLRAWLQRQRNPALTSRIDGSSRSPAGF